MPRFPALTYRPVIKKLKKLKFSFDRMAKGSHELWYNPKTGQRTIVPHHEGKVIKRKTRLVRSDLGARQGRTF